MAIQSEKDDQILQLYIAYEDYLNVEQLSMILSSMDKLYSNLYVAHDHTLSIPLPLETRMRVKECHTGQSIILELSEGIRQIWSSSGLTILGATGIISVMVKLIFGYAKTFAETSKLWYEIKKAKYEAEIAELNARRLKREINDEEARQKLDVHDLDLSGISNHQEQQASEAITEIFTMMNNSPNIREVRVNEITILKKDIEKRNTQ